MNLCKNEKVRKPFLPVHMGPRPNLLSKKNGQKSRDTVPLNSTKTEVLFKARLLNLQLFNDRIT